MLNAFFVYCLFLVPTVALEGVIVCIGTPAPVRGRALRVCVAANLFTHPLATLLMWNWYADFLLVEVLVAMVEFACYIRIVPLPWGRAFGIALFANVLTMLVGVFWWSWSLA